MLPVTPVLAALVLTFLPYSCADSNTDSARLGTDYTSMPLYRNGAGTNVLTVGVGTPEVTVNLTCSTNVAFFIVATSSCDDCTEDSDTYNITDSSSLTTTQQALDYTFIYPAGSLGTLSIGSQLGSEILTDERGETDTPRPIALAATIQENDSGSDLGGSSFTLSDGTAGFWGMGIYQDTKSLSMIPAMTEVSGDGTAAQTTYFTVGFDINNYSTDSTVGAGTVHWGGVPTGAYNGDFNWLDANTSVAGSWGFGLDSMRVENTVIDLSQTYGSVDPGFDAIYVPTSIAEKFFAKVSGASRDATDSTHWNLPCDTNISMTITISGTEYAVSSAELVQPRDAAGVFCWGAVVAWQNGSVPEAKGEVRLGTPFMSNVYTALYYSDSNQYVGFAGKPNSVNASDLVKRSDGHRNSKLAGILIGSLLAALILLFVICYSRNRNSFQSIWYRTIRRQNRAQMNMMVRGATLPPPAMAMPVPMPMPMGMGVPPYMMAPGVGMPMMGNPALTAIRTPYGYQPVPPPYQTPMFRDPYQQGQSQQQPGGHQLPHNQRPLPQAVEQTPQGYYSPRQQAVSLTRSRSSNPMPIPIPGRARQGQSHQQPPPASESGKVRWGRAGARQMRSASSAASADEFGAFASGPGSGRYPQGPGGRGTRHEEFMRRYTGQGEDQPTQVNMIQGTSAPPATGYLPRIQSSGGEEDKKRYFTWRRSDNQDGSEKFQGNYHPVENTSPYSAGKKRSWFGGKASRSSSQGRMPARGWKEAERAHERDRLRESQEV